MSAPRPRIRYILEINYRGDRKGPERVIKLFETTDSESVRMPDLRPANLKPADLRKLTQALQRVEGYSFHFRYNRYERSFTITFKEPMGPLQRNHAAHAIAEVIGQYLSQRRHTHALVRPLGPIAA